MTHDRLAKPAMSVVLITPEGYDVIRRTVRALGRQTVRDRLELVIVGPARERLTPPPAEVEGFAACRLVEIGGLTSSSEARAAGIRAASAPVVCLAEDHCFPAPEWAAALIARHAEPWAGVGAVFLNANPRGVVSRANFLIEYGDWADPPAVSGAEVRHIPGHNSSYKRDALLEYGEKLPDILQAESAMQWDMMARGHRFYLEPRAKMYHLNFSVFPVSLALRFHGGRLFAANRARRWSAPKRALFTLASPAIPLVRGKRVLAAARRLGQLRAATVPVVMLLLAADALGEMVGYAAGGGDAMRILSDWEFRRERFLRPRDRDASGDFRAATQVSSHK